MGTSSIFYWASVAASLYAAYLFAFRVYDMDGYGHPTGKRIVYPNLIYLLALAVCFMPVFNCIATVAFILYGMIGKSFGDFYVDSWFFEKPKQKDEEAKNKD